MVGGGGGGESRAQADCDTRRNTGHPQHPKPMRMEKGKTTGSETERETVRQEQSTYRQGWDNSNADLGTERMEPVPRRIAEQAGRERERERKREREVRRAEGRRSRDHRCRKRKAENGRELAE